MNQGTESILATDFCLHRDPLMIPFNSLPTIKYGIHTSNHASDHFQGDTCIYHGECRICSY